MARISKVTTSGEAAKVLNAKHFLFSDTWEVVSHSLISKGPVCGDIINSPYCPTEYLSIANELSGYNAQCESDRAELLAAAEAVKSIFWVIEAFAPPEARDVREIRENLAAVIAKVKEGE